MNNFLHSQVEQCITQVFEWKNEEDEEAEEERKDGEGAADAPSASDPAAEIEDPATPKIDDIKAAEEESKMDTTSESDKADDAEQRMEQGEEGKKETETEKEAGSPVQEEPQGGVKPSKKPYENPMLIHVRLLHIVKNICSSSLSNS